MAYADVQTALNSIRGLARPNRFTVNLNFNNANLYFSGYAESIDIPPLGVGTADFQFNTQPLLKIPYVKLPAQTCNITFRLDALGNPVKTFYSEINNRIVKNVNGDYFIGYLDDVVGDIDISCLDTEKDKKLFTIKLSYAMLSNIEAVQLSYDERDSYLKQTVTFAYRDASVIWII